MFEIFLVWNDDEIILYATTSRADAEEMVLAYTDEEMYTQFLWDLFYDMTPAVATNYALKDCCWPYYITTLQVAEDD